MWMSTCCVVFRLANHHPVQLYDKLKKEYETQLKPRETINYCEIFVQGARSGPLYWTHRFRIQSGRGRLPNSVPLLLSVATRRACFQAMTAPKGKETSVSGWILKFSALSSRKNWGLLSPQFFWWKPKKENASCEGYGPQIRSSQGLTGPCVNVDLLHWRIIRVFSRYYHVVQQRKSIKWL